ncbi:MAG: hypothetical protein O3C40_02190 [Planctomycetota bacterium]|nr:hypothetical protein [Planctomycetota bacterium]
MRSPTHDSSVKGLPPEQVSGNLESMGPCCDIYSLGVILYQLLTGRLPFQGDLLSVLFQIANDTPEPPSHHRAEVDAEVDQICLNAMAKKVEDRFSTMGEFAKALSDYLKKISTLRAASAEDTFPVADRDTLAREVVVPPPVSVQEPLPDGNPFAQYVREAVAPTLVTTPQPKPPARPKTPSSTVAIQRLRKPAAIAGVLSLTLILASGILFKIKTPYGTVVVEAADGEDVKVAVLQGGKEVSVIDAGGDWTIKLEEGRYNLEIKGGDDRFELNLKAIQVVRDQEVRVSVRMTEVDFQIDDRNLLMDVAFSRVNELLARQEVRAELNISEAQAVRLDAELQALREETSNLLRVEMSDVSMEDRKEVFAESLKQTMALVDQRAPKLVDVLDSNQSRRLVQIVLQWKGPRVLPSEQIGASLALSSEQKQKINELIKSEEERQDSVPRAATREEYSDNLAELHQETDNAVLAVLTPQQRELFESMKGLPFAEIDVLKARGRPREGRSSLRRDQQGGAVITPPSASAQAAERVKAAEGGAVAAAMAEIGRAYDNLKLCRDTKWRNTAQIDPVLEVVVIQHELAKARQNLAGSYDEQFTAWLVEAQKAAAILETTLRENVPVGTDEQFQRLEQSCQKCHGKYRLNASEVNRVK